MLMACPLGWPCRCARGGGRGVRVAVLGGVACTATRRDTMDALDRWVAGVAPSVISDKLARK